MAPINLTYGVYRIEANSLREIYASLCQLVVANGDLVGPRGMNTREMICPTIVIREPSNCLPTGTGRNPSLKIAAVEAIQLCGGFSDPKLTVGASREFERYQEPEGHFHGAYGSRISNQVLHVVRKLRSDPDTRQAVITLWNAHHDNKIGKLDYPCTVSFQFLIRDDKLVLVTNMRSNDVWLGLAYDLFQFGQMQWTVANTLGIECGPLVHRPVSLHAYEQNWDRIAELTLPEGPAHNLYGFSSVPMAYLIGTGQVDPTRKITYTETWFEHRMRETRETPSKP